MAGRKKIVMIDDEVDLCLLIKDNLEETGEFEVITTTNPEETERLCLSQKPDLILLDIVMPKIQGTEIVKALKHRAETRTIPIIVISGLGEIVYFRKKGTWKWLPNRPIVLSRGNIIKEKDSERMVTFKLIAPAAQSVSLAGDFNEWDPQKHVMNRTNDGSWKLAIPLPPGSYQYQYYVDGIWQVDPEAKLRVPNPFGGENAVIEIS